MLHVHTGKRTCSRPGLIHLESDWNRILFRKDLNREKIRNVFVSYRHNLKSVKSPYGRFTQDLVITIRVLTDHHFGIDHLQEDNNNQRNIRNYHQLNLVKSDKQFSARKMKRITSKMSTKKALGPGWAAYRNKGKKLKPKTYSNK